MQIINFWISFCLQRGELKDRESYHISEHPETILLCFCAIKSEQLDVLLYFEVFKFPSIFSSVKCAIVLHVGN